MIAKTFIIVIIIIIGKEFKLVRRFTTLKFTPIVSLKIGRQKKKKEQKL